jgi:hypothetical protein
MDPKFFRKYSDLIVEAERAQQLDEGILDQLKGLIAKAQQLPMIQKHLAAAKAKLPQIVAAAQQSRSGNDLLAKVGAGAVAEGLGGVLGGAALAGLGGSLIAMLADFAMRSYISMGSPSYEQMTHEQGLGFLLLSAFALVGAGGIALGASKAVDAMQQRPQ